MSPNAQRFLQALHAHGGIRDWTGAPSIKLIGAQAGLSEQQAITVAIELERLRLASMNLHLHVRLTPEGKSWCAARAVHLEPARPSRPSLNGNGDGGDLE